MAYKKLYIFNYLVFISIILSFIIYGLIINITWTPLWIRRIFNNNKNNLLEHYNPNNPNVLTGYYQNFELNQFAPANPSINSLNNNIPTNYYCLINYDNSSEHKQPKCVKFDYSNIKKNKYDQITDPNNLCGINILDSQPKKIYYSLKECENDISPCYRIDNEQLDSITKRNKCLNNNSCGWCKDPNNDNNSHCVIGTADGPTEVMKYPQCSYNKSPVDPQVVYGQNEFYEYNGSENQFDRAYILQSNGKII